MSLLTKVNIDENFSLDIFKMTTNTNELVKKFVYTNFFNFERFQVVVENIKFFFQWWEKHESMFPTIGFLAHQILSIIGPQIEIERIFSLVGEFTNFKKYRLQLDNLDKWIFVKKKLA